jgi:hypothetical protein
MYVAQVIGENLAARKADPFELSQGSVRNITPKHSCGNLK